MIGHEITHHFETTGGLQLLKAFAGVLGADQLSEFLEEAEPTHFAIVNVQETTEQGSHWFAVFKHDTSSYEVFDSLGQSEETVRDRFANADYVAFNTTAVQSNESTKCGEFACYFCTCRMLNYDQSFHEVFAECFTTDFIENDKIVQHYWLDGTLYDISEKEDNF